MYVPMLEAAALLGAFLIVLKVIEHGLDVRDLVVALLAPTILGYFMLVWRHSATATGLGEYLLLTAAFYVLPSVLPRAATLRSQGGVRRSGRRADQMNLPLTKGQIRYGIGLTSLGSLYHFAKVGVPLLSTQIDYTRYDFSGSGLLGIPGRLYLFGVPLMTFAAIWYASAHGLGWWRCKESRVAIIVLVATSIAGGFKGGLEQAGTILLIASVATRGPRPLKNILRRGLPFVLAASVFAIAVGSLYIAYRAPGATLPSALKTRLTTEAAQPAAMVIDNTELQPAPRHSVLSDADYFGAEYFHLWHGTPYSLDHLVSASLLGFSPDVKFFIPPVTIGEQAESLHNLGLALAIIWMGLLGFMISRMRGNRGGLRSTLGAYMAWVILLIMIKGDLAYNVINSAAVALLVLGPLMVQSWLRIEGARRRFLDNAPLTVGLGAGANHASVRA